MFTNVSIGIIIKMCILYVLTRKTVLQNRYFGVPGVGVLSSRSRD